MRHYLSFGRLQIIWWGFFTKYVCSSCGRGRFNWAAFKPATGTYAATESRVIFRWIAWGPFELRWFGKRPKKAKK